MEGRSKRNFQFEVVKLIAGLRKVANAGSPGFCIRGVCGRSAGQGRMMPSSA